MCGIAGFIEQSGLDADPKRIVHMTNQLGHRGPDDAGLFAKGPIGLGHRRLSIVDVSSAGHQPMSTSDELSWISYNGELYNHREIRRSFLEGSHFRGCSDTEVLLYALARNGAACLPHLDGIFAFCFVDLRSRVLLLARDHVGIKPLYFAEEGGRFYFASEIKAILAGGLSAEFNPLAALDLVFTGWTADENTLLRRLRRLPPGCLLRYNLDSHSWTIGRWWRPQPSWDRAAELGKQEEVWLSSLTRQVERAVESQLMSDVPVGSFCSGGLDSSLVSAIAVKKRPDIHLFNVSCPDAPKVDEGPWARKVADHLGASLETLILTREEFRRALVHVVFMTEYPLSFVNTVPMYLVSKLARESGVKVLLSGEGADELFGGYIGHHRRLALLRVAQSKGKRAGKGLTRLLDWVTQGATKIGLEPSIEPSLGIHSALTGGLRGLTLLDESEQVYERFSDPLDRAIASALLRELSSYLVPILHRTDRASMAASVEARVPFLSTDLLALALATPPEFKIGVSGLRPVGKALLKRVALAYLPREIVYRPKMGFSVPPDFYLDPWPHAWLRDGFVTSTFGLDPKELASWIRGQNEQSACWMLTLEVWGQLFIRGRSPEEVTADYLYGPRVL